MDVKANVTSREELACNANRLEYDARPRRRRCRRGRRRVAALHVKRPEEGWKYGVGFVTEEVLREHVPEGGDDTLALACGPPPMIKFAVSPNLEKMKYDMANSFIVF
ncbi:hypothetical protein OsJ_27623 [Oryza sativa Japonica Group]|uniref:Oxidoreductase FAD/NAD(P)-binding domain-containing protein n=1 Tax=Oryza sativa subsp. japonica TaxID=39947 RepID=B9G1C3_ORYSJ|nr:hypothetical protein OsJ_27623 [Oryza sativa Japonica Group]